MTPAFKPRRRRGPQSKIAQLSAELRALVNELLGQDKTYEEVVEEMAKHGVSLNTDNVSKWFNGPYQDYLAALDWQDELQQLREHAFSFGQEEGNVRFQEGLVQIGLTQLFRAIKDDRFKDDPANGLRLFNSLARLSREALVIRKYADQHAKEKVNELKRLNPNRQISKVEETAMQDRADDFFGLKSAARLKPGLDSVRTDSTPSPTSASPSDPPVDPLPPAGAPAPNCSSRGEEALINEQPMPNEPARVASATSLAATSASQSKIETQKSKTTLSQSAEVADATPAGTPHPESTPESQQSQIEIQNSKIETPQLCPQCQHILPPLMPDGQHPWPGCWFCGIRLLPPGTELCPNCQQPLPFLTSDGRRPYPDCRLCGAPVPPSPKPTTGLGRSPITRYLVESINKNPKL